MNDWTNDFLTHCLEGVPEGTYRDRTERELRDHLLSLSRDLEGAGYAPEEAQTLAQSRMGDPAELARRCLREWRRRQIRRGLICAEMFLFEVCIWLAGLLYLTNAKNFGKSIVAYWGLVAIPTAGFMFHSFGFFFQRWTTTRICCLILTAIQLPPILCWMAFSGSLGFEMSGVMVPGWAGVLVHILLFLWGAANYCAVTQIQTYETPPAQTA